MQRPTVSSGGTKWHILFCLLAITCGTSQAQVEPAGPANVEADGLTAAVSVAGGLVVQVGAVELDDAVSLARTGRFLVQVLDADDAVVEQARRQLRDHGVYGLASADRLPSAGSLPYTENLVNLLLVAPEMSARVTPQEAHRVLCPGGIVLFGRGKLAAEHFSAAGFVDARGVPGWADWLVAKKPWPEGMDGWTHPRHSAAGNAVSRDTLVGPPRRVRWVVGAQAEVRGMVSSDGRNFYAGVLARDGFNGLRLWHRDLVGPPGAAGFKMRNLGPENVPPVAQADRLYVVDGKRLVALDAASGETVREYPDAGEPRMVLIERGMLVVTTSDSVRALDAESTGLKWTFACAAPRQLVAGDDTVALIQGRTERGEPVATVVLDRETGAVRWKRDDLPWLPKVMRTVYHRGLVAYEVSTLNDHGPGNVLYLLSAADGTVDLEHPFLPGMNHVRQARAMFLEDRLWLLHGGKGNADERFPIRVSALNFKNGEVLATHRAGLAHCFPPVMTSRYMLSGEFDLTDLATGEVDARQITKAACGQDGGWVPANGLIYVTPKHCVCWPMVRGYTALATERPAGSVAEMDLQPSDFLIETSGEAPATQSAPTGDADWPCYRHDAWRSGSTPAAAPQTLQIRWSVDFGDDAPSGPIVDDWRENMFIKGPITAPVIAGNRVLIARPDAHEVIGLDAGDGSVAWRFTANGRVDTSPTIHQNLSLFGTKSGWVYCLRLDNGRMVWRLRAAPVEEQIVAYGQLESPWPVPGSVLVIDDVAYFAAGRQSLADGGIWIFAVQPSSGRIQWVQRLDSVPQRGFYECSGLEFDNFDLLHREGDRVGMSRWSFDRATGEMAVDRWAVFAKLDTGGGTAIVPRGCWSYAPRHQPRIPSYTARRPMTLFRGDVLFGCLQGSTTVFRRDFQPDEVASFDTRWITGWAASGLSRDGKMPWPNHRLAEKASWQVDAFAQTDAPPSIDAAVLAGDRLLIAGSSGDLRVLAAADGKQIDQQSLPAPLWDGMAIAKGRLYYATADGRLLCLGE